MFQNVCLPLHTIQEEPLPGHLKNKIEKITFSLKLFKLDEQTIECNIVLGLIGKLNKVG